MTTWGYTLSSEEHRPADLVRHAGLAERAGFEFLSISDHFHPWIDEQGHSPFDWAVLGGVAQATSTVRVGTGVTCPILRIHPAIVAQAAATTALLFEGRFFLGVGTGEALNEHVLGQRWPSTEVRQEMLAEALHVMRELWKGDTVDLHGTHYTVENARLYDVPDDPIPIVVSAFGTKAAELAARDGDGIWMTSPRDDVLRAFRHANGTGPRIGQYTLCWAPTEAEGVATARRVWPNTGLPGQLAQDLPTPSHFQQATSLVTEELIAEQVACGPDADRVLEELRSYEGKGLDHIHLHQIGPDQEGFLAFWENELRPKL
jgi:coenzyme F420-dependent glucose-6-phosphate dehydrogenase